MAYEPREFSPEVLQELIDKINQDPSLLDKDWREVVKRHFKFPPGEENNLNELSREKVQHIQDYLTQVRKSLRESGGITGKLTQRSKEERTDKLVYDVEIDLGGTPTPE